VSAPRRRWGRGTDLLLTLGAMAARVVARSLFATWRIEVVAGEEHRREALDRGEPVILCFWHEDLVIFAPWLALRWLGRGLKMTILTSRSKDGELLARLAWSAGFEVVRGSTSRGGSTAFRVLHRSLVKDGLSPVFVPDGPRGPAHVVKTGAIALAQLTGAPIIALGAAARRARRLGSWDRMIVPWFFTRVTFAVGEPLRIPRDLAADQMERERARLQESLDELTRVAEEAV